MPNHETSAQDFENFLYHVTHDLKANIRAIRVLPDWIAEDISEDNLVLPEAVVGHIDMLRNYATNMDVMLDGLTNLSRIGRMADAGGFHNFDNLLMEAWLEVEGSEHFHLDIESDVDSVYGPKNEISSLFRVIFSNSIVHHCQESGKISVKAKKAGKRVEIRVTDDGPGIEGKYRDIVFEPLKTLRSKEELGSAGVGLSIARKIVSNQSGKIEITEDPELPGCSVLFDLPAGPLPACSE